MTSEEATTHDATGGRVAFRLTDETPVYAEPNGSAVTEEVLPAGSLVTIYERAGDYLHVITPGDNFGYIAAATPMEPARRPSNVDQLQAQQRERAAAIAAQGDPLVAAAAMQAVRNDALATERRDALRASDADWRPEPLKITPEERILIYDRIDTNKRSTFFLIIGFTLFIALFFAAIGAVVGFSSPDLTLRSQALLSGAAGGFAAAVALPAGIGMYFSSTRMVLGISGAREVTEDEEPVLYRTVENLSIGSGLPMPKVWVIEDSAPNAFATGRNPAGGHVAATRGLLDKLEKRELEAVMAHEVSHVGNYDTRIMTLMAVAVGLIAMISDMMLRFTRFGAGHRSSNRDKGGGALGVLIIVLAIVFIAVAPIIAGLMRLAMSRQREYLADASGALLCRNPDALADALQKIAADPEPLEVANKATAHMYIANPLKGHGSFLNNLFSTHPPVEERVRILRSMA